MPSSEDDLSSSDLVAAAPVRDGKILLGLRAAHKQAFANHWDLAGGHVEAGETDQQALIRELDEELGIRPERYARIADIMVPENDTPLRMAVFRVDAWSGDLHLANDEHSALRWFDEATLSQASPLAGEFYLPLFASLMDSKAGAI